MKAVIDTNVVVSGLFWKGPPAEVLAAWVSGKFEWIVSASILAEYHTALQTLSAKYPPPASALTFLRGVTLSAKLTTPIDLEEQVCTDSDDDKFVAVAIAGQATTIVSGDKALLKVDGYRGLRIIGPAAFLKMM